jgi:hypothetical protein
MHYYFCVGLHPITEDAATIVPPALTPAQLYADPMLRQLAANSIRSALHPQSTHSGTMQVYTAKLIHALASLVVVCVSVSLTVEPQQETL